MLRREELQGARERHSPQDEHAGEEGPDTPAGSYYIHVYKTLSPRLLPPSSSSSSGVRIRAARSNGRCAASARGVIDSKELRERRRGRRERESCVRVADTHRGVRIFNDGYVLDYAGACYNRARIAGCANMGRECVLMEKAERCADAD